jgi:hypothetical protein
MSKPLIFLLIQSGDKQGPHKHPQPKSRHGNYGNFLSFWLKPKTSRTRGIKIATHYDAENISAMVDGVVMMHGMVKNCRTGK